LDGTFAQHPLLPESDRRHHAYVDKRISVIMLLVMTVFIGFGIIIPVMPEVVAPRHLGWLLALYSLASLIMSPYWGALSERIGRKPVIMIGMFGFSVSFFVFGISLEHLWLLYVSRILGGLFSGAVTSVAVAYVSDITTEDNRTKGMGMIGMSIGLGFIFGPAVGGLLGAVSHSLPFFVSSSLALVTLFFTFTMLEESLDADRKPARRGANRLERKKAFAGPMKFLYALGFFVSFTLAGLESTLLYFEKEVFPITTRDFGLMLLISGVVGAAIQGGYVRRFVKKGDEGKVILAGLVLCAAGFYLLLMSANFLTATLYLCVFSAGNALLRPCVTSLITQKTKVSVGVASGLSSSMDSLGRIAGPLFGTGLFAIGADLPYLVSGSLCLAALGLLAGFYAQVRKERTAGGN